MNPVLSNTLYVALLCYGIGTLIALASLFTRDKRPQFTALVVMVAGFVAQTVWIGTICVKTGHPPLENLPEAASFTGWTLLLISIALYFFYRVYAASFFVYPVVFVLLLVTPLVGEPFKHLNPALRSSLFTAHLLLTTVGIAGLLIGLAFTVLAWAQDRSLKSKKRGPLWDLIPSLTVAKTVSYRALAIGFSIYTLGLITGILWSYRTTAGPMDISAKTMGAIVAWLFFGALLQSFTIGSYRARRTLVISACAFVAIVIAILGIAHG